ncbi:MAG: 2-C-methyl-D-erythritol 4-phosphate cytidylyltransferase [Flavobacteriales bacterium]
MQRATIIVAGGMGRRLGGAIPKQFQLVAGKPMLCWTIAAFRSFDARMPIVVVLPEPHISIWKTLCIGHNFHDEHTVVAGGEERFHSVREGVKAISGDVVIAVHDGVRPAVSRALIERCFAHAAEHGSAVPVVPITVSVREVDGNNSKPLDRSRLRAVQTPQCFHAGLLRKAFELPFEPGFTDEATLVERTGTIVQLVDGEDNNMKVTTTTDLRLVEMFLPGPVKV